MNEENYSKPELIARAFALAGFLFLGLLLIAATSDKRQGFETHSIITTVTATEGCSDPEYYNEMFDIERCNEGSYLINRETGERSWTGTANGLGKACSPNIGETDLDMCIVTP